MLQTFLEDVLPAEGLYCLFLLPERRHLWAKSLVELADLAEKHVDRTGVYFGTSSFASTADRTQSNVFALRTLRLDIDAGVKKFTKNPKNAYPTQRDALAACVTFFKDSGLLPSYIVSSGEGLHIYFCIDDALPPGEWLLLAKGLSALGARHGMKIDPSVTEDSARVLRPVGALHDNGKRVAILKRTGVVYTAADLRARLEVVPAATRQFDMSVNDDLTLGYEGPPSSALKVAQHCGALREVAEARGDVQEPLWRAMIGLVKRCTEGEELVHEWSSGYSGYDEDETQRKFDNWTTGPTTCAEFGRHSDACLTCEYRTRIKSPIHLGMMTPVEVEQLPEEKRPAPEPAPEPEVAGMPWEGQIPEGFFVKTDENGRHSLVARIKSEKMSETGELVDTYQKVVFTHEVFWFGQWAEADNSGDCAQITLHLWDGKSAVKRYMMDQTVMASQAELIKYLGGKSIHTTTHKKANQAMTEYAKASLLRIRNFGKRPKIFDHLGLRVLSDGKLVCAHGKHVIHGDGTIEEGVLGNALLSAAETYTLPIPGSATGTWSADVWGKTLLPKARQHVDFLRKYYGPGTEKFQLAIMLGLASPLMAFTTGEFLSGSVLPRMTSLSVSLYSSETARGKTTACQSVALAFGNVSAQVNDSGKMGATDLGRVGRLSTLGTMPSIMDEMGGASAASVANLISAVANGAGRLTVKQDRSMRQEAPWSLINLITTNTSQRDMVAAVQANSSAIQHRLLEINVADAPTYDQELRDSFTSDWAALAPCAGALGAVIHFAICRVGVAGMNKLVTHWVSEAGKLVGADQSERFQYRGLGAMLALVALLDKLGLAPFAKGPLIETFKAAHDVGRDYINMNILPSDSLERLARALLDLAPHTIVTEGETRSGPKSTKFDVPLNTRMPDKIVARHIKSTGRTYLDVEAFKTWCRENGVNEQEIVRAARKSGVFVLGEGRNNGKTWHKAVDYFNLTKGMKENMQLRCRVYTIETRHLAGYTGRNTSPEAEEHEEAEA